jgi:hypothetical protein
MYFEATVKNQLKGQVRFEEDKLEEHNVCNVLRYWALTSVTKIVKIQIQKVGRELWTSRVSYLLFSAFVAKGPTSSGSFCCFSDGVFPKRSG